MQNIIKNGLDHGNKEINIQLTKNGNEAELVFRNKVTDPGEIDIKRVFERFYKADRARSKNSTGLGLSIARALVEQMHGQMDAA
jgi:signal transduction histidine kinase